MARRPITNPLEYLGIARRRWVWMVAPFLVIAAVTAVVARRLPKLYRSDALILVEPQKVPADFVKPTVSSNVAERLESMQEQILSRTSLSHLIKQYGLYRGSGLSIDAEVSLMLNHITVTPIGDPDARQQAITAFRIAYENPNPVLAQQITGKLAALYIADNLRARSEQSQGTEQFIDGRLAAAQQKLASLETSLRNLRLHYMGSLPEQEAANLQVMSQLQTAMGANANSLARAEQQRAYLTSLGEAVEHRGPGGALLAGAGAPTADEAALQQAQAQLAVAEQMYTPAHPDVIRLKAKVKALTAQVRAGRAA
ncbi:MAG: hypothetical protein ACRD1F_12980, partial [Terriglobales bacterium]